MQNCNTPIFPYMQKIDYFSVADSPSENQNHFTQILREIIFADFGSDKNYNNYILCIVCNVTAEKHQTCSLRDSKIGKVDFT